VEFIDFVFLEGYMVLLMAEILHQLIGSLPHFYGVLYILSGAGFLPSTVFMVLLRVKL